MILCSFLPKGFFLSLVDNEKTILPNIIPFPIPFPKQRTKPKPRTSTDPTPKPNSNIKIHILKWAHKGRLGVDPTNACRKRNRAVNRRTFFVLVFKKKDKRNWQTDTKKKKKAKGKNTTLCNNKCINILYTTLYTHIYSTYRYKKKEGWGGVGGQE